MKLDLEANVSETTRLLRDGAGDLVSDPLKMVDKLNIIDQSAASKTVTSYDAEDLTHWSAITIYTGSIFTQRAVMRIIFLQTLTCWAVAYVLYYATSHPENYKTNAVQKVIKTITISIAFLLGLFLNQCVSRWWATVLAIEKLQGTMKKMVMSAINLNLRKESRETLTRCCVLSIRMLDAEITHAKHEGRQKTKKRVLGLGDGPTPVDLDKYWEDIFTSLLRDGCMIESELEVLKSIPPTERSFFCWSLVGSELHSQRTDMVEGYGIDPVAYDRLCKLAQEGMGSVSSIKILAAYQLPFIYVHMLAFMVHFVNIMTAVGTGVTIGLLLAKSRALKKPLDMSEVSSNMVFVVVQAFLYQAFLSIGAALSFPITGSAYNISLLELVETLERQLKLMEKLHGGPK